MTLTYEQVAEFLPAYAIGALDVEEHDAVDEYFRLQDELRQKLASAESATILLAQDTDHAELAADAMERLMARVSTEVESGAETGIEVEAEAETDIETDAAEREARESVEGAVSGEAAGEYVRDEGTNGDRSGRRKVVSPLTRKRVVERPAGGREPRTARSAAQRSGRAQAAAQSGQKRSAEAREPKSKPFFFSNMINGRALKNAALAALAASVAAMILLGGLSNQLYKQTRTLQGEASELRAKNVALAETNEQIQSGRVALLDEYMDLEIVYEETALERVALYEENKRLQSQLSQENERITLVGAASQATVMFGTDEAPGLQGTFFHKDEEGALVVHGLKPLPLNQTYQFWLVTEEGEQVSAGLFAVDKNLEPTWANLTLPADVPPYAVVGVTIEPSTGSTAPTGPMLLESNVSFGESSS